MSELFDAFWQDVGELEAAIAPYRAELISGRPSAPAKDAAVRFGHTLKASAAYVSLADLEARAHVLARAAALPDGQIAEAFGAVSAELDRARPSRTLSPIAPGDDRSGAVTFETLCAPVFTIAAALAEAGGPALDVVIEGGAAPIPMALASPLREALIEGVRNAARHGVEAPEVRRARGKPDRGVVTLAARRAPEGLVITITDDGAGVDAAKLAQAAAARGLAFDPSDATGLARLLTTPGFTTAQSTGPSTGSGTDPASGAGLGLAILADTAKRLGGQLAVETRAEAGATLRLVLPDAPCAPPAASGPRHSQGHVLVIEDDAFFRAMLTPLLEAAGYRVTAIDAAAGAFALSRGGARFDAVVADLDGAAGEGLAFAAAAAADPDWASAARLGLTTHFSASADARGAFHDTIAKTDRASLLAALARARRAAFAA